MAVRVQEAAFDIGAETVGFINNRSDMGAVVTFTGIVRDLAGGLQHMMIEHYPGMTKSAIEAIEAQAVARWNLGDSLIIHRYGKLVPGAHIMMVATAAPHRADAFAAAEFLMDYLKFRAPFWKKEVTAQGESWVDSRDEDEEAIGRWQEPDQKM